MNVFVYSIWMEWKAATPAELALVEDLTGKTLAELYLASVFATSNRRSICFQSDEEAEATPAESGRLERNPF